MKRIRNKVWLQKGAEGLWKRNTEKTILYVVRIFEGWTKLNQVNGFFFKIGWCKTGFGLFLVREQTFPGMLLLITDCVNFCAFKWSAFTFEIFFFHLSSRNNCFTVTYDSIWLGFLKTLWNLWQTFQMSILIKVLLTSS